MTSMSDPLVGHVLDGRYEILSRLARGGMATVYRALDRRLTRTVAVKVMHDGLGDDAEFARKFDREARSAAILSNPHIVSVFDQGSDEDRPYIVMEFVDGCTLRHVISREGPLDPLRALDLLEPVVSALATAHEAGIVHRDIKPENVLISDRGQIKVADFGLARAVSGQTATATQGLLIGTVSYLPPELVTTGRTDARGDVYSTGVVLFEMLTGKKPHTGDIPIQVAYQHVHSDIPAPSVALAKDGGTRRLIPPYLDALVVACTRRTAAERPQDGLELQRLMRLARKALSSGIMDDPTLTQEMSRSFSHAEHQGPAAAALPVPEWVRQGSPGSAPTTITERPASDPVLPAPRASVPSTRTPRTPDSPRSPGSPRTAATGRITNLTSMPAPSGRPVSAAPRSSTLVRRRRRAVVAMIMLLLLALVAGWLTYQAVQRAKYTTAPTLTDMSETQATQIATANHLKVAFTNGYSETVAKGTIISADPSAGARVRKDSTIDAVVSLGPERYTVPTLVGLAKDAALAALKTNHLTTGTVTEAYDELVAAGKVVSASLKAGDRVKRDTSCDLVISKGPQPIPIASYVNNTASDATTKLQAAGFKVASKHQHSKTVAEGKVISQTPNPGNGKRGDTITLVVSDGPVMVKVPGVFRLSEASARAALTSKGFAVVVQYTTPSWLRLDITSAQSPFSGKSLPQGSTVTIWVS